MKIPVNCGVNNAVSWGKKHASKITIKMHTIAVKCAVNRSKNAVAEKHNTQCKWALRVFTAILSLCTLQ